MTDVKRMEAKTDTHEKTDDERLEADIKAQMKRYPWIDREAAIANINRWS